MYLQKLLLRNIKCFSYLEIDFTRDNEIELWTTLFGKNGLGKSTLLQAIGATLAGPSAVRELLPVAEGWVRQGCDYGEIEAHLQWTEGDALVPGWPKKNTPYVARYIVTGENPERLPRSLAELYYTVPTLVPWSGEGSAKERENITKDLRRLQQTAYAEGKVGWLGCGYGPFRRLSGGGQDADRILYAERRSARFVTLFREDAALTSATEWLIKLHNTAREGDFASQRALESVKKAFETRLFPQPAILDVDARSVLLKTGNERPIRLHDLSDGYRSMLALSIDLLRWLIHAFPDSNNPMQGAGIVLIDELDAHLHPAWQREIGHWLREKFPNIQFIVATHSPFLAQVADSDPDFDNNAPQERNSHSSNIVLQKTEAGVKILPVESVQDLRVDQIYQSPLFDLASLYSPKTEKKLQRHEQLEHKRATGSLSEDEDQEYEQLSLWREAMPLIANPAEQNLEQALHKAIQHHTDQLREIV